jgi:hypothetical protein
LFLIFEFFFPRYRYVDSVYNSLQQCALNQVNICDSVLR